MLKTDSMDADNFRKPGSNKDERGPRGECSLTQEVSELLHTKSLRGRKSLEHFPKFNQTETKFLKASFERAFLRSPSQQGHLGDVVPRG